MVVISSGCAGVKIPDLHPHVILPSKSLCGRYEQISKDPIQFSEKVVEWKSLSSCEGYIALPPEDIAAARAAYDAWYRAHHRNDQ